MELTASVWNASERLSPLLRKRMRRLIDTLGAPFLGSINGADSGHEVAVTFDDGPEPAVTLNLLDLLREEDVKVTFFVLLTQCRRYPELLDAIVRDGHEVGLHGVDHRRITGLPFRLAVDYLRRARCELELLIGQPVRFYRPPYGSQSATSLYAVHKAGMTTVVWSCDGADWVDRDVESVVRASMTGLSSGGILLLHERLEPDPLRDAPETSFDRIHMARLLLKEIDGRGWRPVQVGRMIDESAARRTVWLRP
jgi:peptidoglycan/xylan/chitin deacetylase (PgdA/CDA1 family)